MNANTSIEAPVSSFLLCLRDGSFMELDLNTTSPEELAAAITDPATREFVKDKWQKVQDFNEQERVRKKNEAANKLLNESWKRGNADGLATEKLNGPTNEMTFYLPPELTLDDAEKQTFILILRLRFLEGFYAGFWCSRHRAGALSKIILRNEMAGLQ